MNTLLDQRIMERFHADLSSVRQRVDAYLARLFEHTLTDSARVLGRGSPGLAPLRTMALAGGKRIRPAFTYWAFIAANGCPDDERVIEAGAVLELLHLFALVHDDVMDEAPIRRAQPTLHVVFADRHRSLGLQGSSQRYGENMAILLGDFALLTCTKLAMSLPEAARRIFYQSATQLMFGQYRDLESATSATANDDYESYSKTALMKTASYTVEGPLLIGAALTPRGAELEPYLRRYGQAIGQVFQHRDDLLDVFGEEHETGKPVAGDLLHQKATRLMAILRARTTGSDRAQLALLERPAADAIELESVRALLRRSGAAEELNQLIDGLTNSAIEAINEAPMSSSCREILIGAAHFAGSRDR